VQRVIKKKITKKLLSVFINVGKKTINLKKNNLKIYIKDDNTPVTNGDLEVDRILQKEIKKLTPNIPIVSEENSSLMINSRYKSFWLLDPIDGTKEYILGKKEYTLNAALIIKKKPVIGIIYAPRISRLFFTYEKNKSYEFFKNKIKRLNSKIYLNKKNIKALSNSHKPSKNILNIYKKFKVKTFKKCSSSLKFCLIAAGEYDIYAARPRAKEWDIAAGHIIAENAGAILRTFSGRIINYGKKKFYNPSMILYRNKKI